MFAKILIAVYIHSKPALIKSIRLIRNKNRKFLNGVWFDMNRLCSPQPVAVTEKGFEHTKQKQSGHFMPQARFLVTFNSKESYFLYHSKPNALNCTRSLQPFGKHFVIFLQLDLCGSLESVFIPVRKKIGLLEL